MEKQDCYEAMLKLILLILKWRYLDREFYHKK